MAPSLATARQKLRLARAVYRLVRILGKTFKPFADRKGRLSAAVASDEFVLAYLAGTAISFLNASNALDKGAGVVLWKCFEHFFPGRGLELSRLFVTRYRAGDDSFRRVMDIAWKEMKEHLKSAGRSGLPSLARHLAGIARDPSEEGSNLPLASR
jgi:hypothetical protein